MIVKQEFVAAATDSESTASAKEEEEGEEVCEASAAGVSKIYDILIYLVSVFIKGRIT